MAHRKKACIEHKQTYSKFRNCSSKHYSLQETGRGDNASSWRLKIKSKFWNSQKIIRLGALKSDFIWHDWQFQYNFNYKNIFKSRFLNRFAMTTAEKNVFFCKSRRSQLKGKLQQGSLKASAGGICACVWTMVVRGGRNTFIVFSTHSL